MRYSKMLDEYLQNYLLHIHSRILQFICHAMLSYKIDILLCCKDDFAKQITKIEDLEPVGASKCGMIFRLFIFWATKSVMCLAVR